MTGVTRRWVTEGWRLGTAAGRIETRSPRTPSTRSTGGEEALNHGVSRGLNGQEIWRRKAFRGPISKVYALSKYNGLSGYICSIFPHSTQELFPSVGPFHVCSIHHCYSFFETEIERHPKCGIDGLGQSTMTHAKWNSIRARRVRVRSAWT